MSDDGGIFQIRSNRPLSGKDRAPCRESGRLEMLEGFSNHYL